MAERIIRIAVGLIAILGGAFSMLCSVLTWHKCFAEKSTEYKIVAIWMGIVMLGFAAILFVFGARLLG